MSFPASDVINRARDSHPAFNEVVGPTPVLLRRLSDKALELHALVVKYEPELLVSTESVSLPLADFNAGHPLTGVMEFPQGGDVIFRDGTREPFEIVDWALRNDVVPRWSGWLDGLPESTTLHLIGVAADWTAPSSIELRYVAGQTEISGLADTIALPPRARNVLVADLVRLLARRVPRTHPVAIDRRELAGEAVSAEALFTESLTIRQRVKASHTREVW